MVLYFQPQMRQLNLGFLQMTVSWCHWWRKFHSISFFLKQKTEIRVLLLNPPEMNRTVNSRLILSESFTRRQFHDLLWKRKKQTVCLSVCICSLCTTQLLFKNADPRPQAPPTELEPPFPQDSWVGCAHRTWEALLSTVCLHRPLWPGL